MIQIPLEIGDTILAGRFKNKKIKVNEIGYDDFGSPTINGRSILKIRIPKLYQQQENEMKTNIKEALTPDKLKTIDKKIVWGTEKDLPASQGYAINDLVKRYKIPAIKWGYAGTGQFIGIETNKQKIFWRDKGSKLEFLGILNKDGSVAENKTLKEAVNPFQKSPLEVKIKQTDGSWHIYLQTVDGEECITMTGWGTKEQAEHAAMMKGYSFDANKSNETPTRDVPKYTGYEKVRSEKPEEMKLSKEKKIEIKLEGMMREILGKKKALIEADVTDKPELEAKAKRYAEIANKMKQLEAELKALEPEFEQLDQEFRPLLETIGKTKDTFIRAGKLLIKIERAGYDKNSASYKTGFEYLYNKVNGTMKDLADEALAMTKTVSYVKSKISVVQGESNINEENWLTKIKSFLTNKFKKIFNLNNAANAELSKLEKMV